MPLFVIFVFGAVIFGAGVMLSPGWPTKQPRIGLAAALALALVMGGSVFWAMLFGWDTLVVDYIFFALLTAIFLGGTLSYGQKRAEERGEILEDADQGWPGPQDLLFFLFVALVFIVPVFVLPVPLDTDAQGFGYLALMAREGGGFDTLAPFQPDVTYLYAPGWTAIIAYFSERLGQGIHLIQFGLASVLGLLNVWLAYDLGAEVRDKRLGRALALAMLGGLGLFTAYMDSHYTSLLALAFSLAFIIYAYRYLRDNMLIDLIAAGLMLGAVVISHPDTTIILGLGFAPWLLSMWFAEPRPTVPVWLALVFGIPLIALLAIAPWLLNTVDLLGSDIVSPFERSGSYWQVMTLPPYHNPLLLPFVVIGAVIGVRRRDSLAFLALGWLVLAFDFAVLGISEFLFGFLPVFRYDYPFSIAWHAPIIPYTILGGYGLLWAWDTQVVPRFGGRMPGRAVYGGLAALIMLTLLAGVFNQQMLATSKALGVNFYGAFSSHADVDAMTWIRENTAAGVRLLNFPGPQEGDWVPVIAERESVYFRDQPFFRGQDDYLDEQLAMRTFWRDPADPDNAELLQDANISYVIVPEIVGDPDSFETAWRWNEPFAWEFPMDSPVAEAEYLELVYESGGAQIYRFAPIADMVEAAAPEAETEDPAGS